MLGSTLRPATPEGPDGPNPATDDRTLLLQARTRALASLQSACAPIHRAAVEQTIADLDARLAELAETLPSGSDGVSNQSDI